MGKTVFLTLCALCAWQTQAYLPTATPESQGVDSRAVAAWIDANEKEVDALHGFVLLRHGKLVAEGYWAPYARGRAHMLYSHSKSFTSTAVGFLVRDGKLDLDERAAAIFPDKLPEKPGENLLRVRVRDLLTMTTGSEKDSTASIHAAGGGDWLKAFFAHPVEREPGTHFVYNSGATYVLAAIVERRSGEKLMDYLGARLFAPLGIAGAWTTTCPNGIACGGWGMNMTTRDIALFGQFCLQEGRWEGRELLPADWVRMATAKQTETGRDTQTDWGRGYGFQFWRCLPKDVYRADGARGQYTLVMPEQDAVLSINAGVSDMGKVLRIVWDRILPGFADAPLPENKPAADALAARCAALALPCVKGEREGLTTVLGADYVYETNTMAVTRARLDATADGWEFRYAGPCGEQRIPIGHNTWKEGSVVLEKGTYEGLGALIGEQPTASSGAWTAPDVFTFRTYLTGGPACIDTTLKFTAATLTADVKFTAMRSPRHTFIGSRQ